MGINSVNYVLDRKYVNDTASALGAVKGAPCQVDSVVKKNGLTTVTLKWIADDKTTVNYTSFDIEDGQGLMSWVPGDSYTYNDICIYQNMLYRCTVSNSDMVFNPSHWAKLNDSDPQFGICDVYSSLPARITTQDSILYLVEQDEVISGVTYRKGFYNCSQGVWNRTTPPVLDRFTEVQLADGTYELYFDGNRVVTEEDQKYLIVDEYADIDTTVKNNTVFFVENADYNSDGSIAHYSGEYLYDVATTTITFLQERETKDIDFNNSGEYAPVAVV